jgi:hypothetical protein
MKKHVVKSVKKIKVSYSKQNKRAIVYLIVLVGVIGCAIYLLKFSKINETTSGVSIEDNKLCQVFSKSQNKIVDVPCEEKAINEPSERALKAAAYAYLNMDKQSQKDMQNKMLATGSAELTIKNMAVWLDSDLTKLVMVEALMQKSQSNSNSNSGNQGSLTTIVQPTVNPQSVLDKYQVEERQRCQEKSNKYSLCLSEYNLKMNEYNTCLTEKLTNEWKFCSTPLNLCGVKPYCAY